MVTPLKWRKITENDSIDSTIIYEETQRTPTKPSKRLTKKQIEELLQIEDDEINKSFEIYGKLDTNNLNTSRSLISFAFQNKENTDNLLVLEFSEAFLIQFCDLSRKITFRNMTWDEACNIVIPNLFSPQITLALRKNSGLSHNLYFYLKKNHKYKIAKFNMSPSAMFLTRPNINYDLIKYYEVTQDFNCSSNKQITIERKK